jgi:hypothetical protein
MPRKLTRRAVSASPPAARSPAAWFPASAPFGKRRNIGVPEISK